MLLYMKGIFLGRRDMLSDVWLPQQHLLLEKYIDLLPVPVSPLEMEQHADWLAQTEVIFSTWGMPLLSKAQKTRLS